MARRVSVLMWSCGGCGALLSLPWRCATCDVRERRLALEADIDRNAFGMLSTQGNAALSMVADSVEFGESRADSPEQLKRFIGRLLAPVAKHHPEVIDQVPLAHLVVALQRVGVAFADPSDLSGSWIVDVIGRELFPERTGQTR